jgi:glycosyltransferase involved in cell wall biosynthesis
MLPQKPFRVLIATPLGEGGKGGIDRLNDSIMRSVAAQPELNVNVTRLVTRGQGRLFQAQFVFASALGRLAIAALLGRVDLLHIHLALRGSSYRKALVGAAARLLGIPYIVHLHGFDFREFWSSTNRFVASGIDRLFTRSARIIVMGEYWADVITERLPAVAGKIDLLPNATPAASSPPIPAVDQRVRIVFLGELGARKGSFDLVRALGRVAHRTDWTATMAGNGQIDETLKAVRQLRIADRVRVPGWLDVGERDELLRATDILVLPSTAENLPMVIIEAFARGIAVISTPVGAIPSVISHERNGLLVPVGDVEKLAEALERLIADSALRVHLGKAAQRDHAKRYDFNGYIRRLVAIWRGAVPQGQARSERLELNRRKSAKVSHRDCGVSRSRDG